MVSKADNGLPKRVGCGEYPNHINRERCGSFVTTSYALLTPSVPWSIIKPAGRPWYRVERHKSRPRPSPEGTWQGNLVATWRSEEQERYLEVPSRLPSVMHPAAAGCVVCEYEVHVEAAHLTPKHELSDDRVENGAPLCPNHHWELDNGNLSSDQVRRARDARRLIDK